MLPFALATIVGGIDCTESAAAAGDEYDTRSILWTEGLASVLAGLFGGVIQTTPYIGQPAYKAMGGRAAYTLATALFIGLAGGLGWFAHLFEWLPEAACFPILVFVGLEIGAQSFRATPTRHYAALALAMLPALAYLATDPAGHGLGTGPATGARRGVDDSRPALPGQRVHRDEPAVGLGPGGSARSADVSCRRVSWRGRGLQPRGHYPFAADAGGDRLAVGCLCPDAGEDAANTARFSANRPITGRADTCLPRRWSC